MNSSENKQQNECVSCLYGLDGRAVASAFRMPKYEALDSADEALTVKKPTEVFSDTESREALEGVIDGILTQGHCGNNAVLDVVHHKDGSETWTLTAIEDSLAEGLAEEDITEAKDITKLVIIIDVSPDGMVTRTSGLDGFSPALNCRIDAQGFIEFLRAQVTNYGIKVASERSAGVPVTTQGITASMSTNIRDTAQDLARAVDTVIQSVCADYIIDLTRVYSTTIVEDALVTYTGNYSDKDKMPHRVDIALVNDENAVAMAVCVDGRDVQTTPNITSAEPLAQWVRDNAAYRMNEGRRLSLRRAVTE